MKITNTKYNFTTQVNGGDIKEHKRITISWVNVLIYAAIMGVILLHVLNGGYF